MDWFLGKTGKTGKTVNTGKTANNGTTINHNIPFYYIPNSTLDLFSRYMTNNLSLNIQREKKKYYIQKNFKKKIDESYKDLIKNINNLDYFIQKFFNCRLNIGPKDRETIYKFDILFIYFLKKNKDKMAIFLQDTRVEKFIEIYTRYFDQDFITILNKTKQKDANANAIHNRYMNIPLNRTNIPVNITQPNQPPNQQPSQPANQQPSQPASQPASKPASQQPNNRNVLETSYNTNIEQIIHFLERQIYVLEQQINKLKNNINKLEGKNKNNRSSQKKIYEEYVKKYTEILACIAKKNKIYNENT